MAELKKILVVGAGVAGLALSYWLRRFGLFPTLIEKSNVVRKNGIGLDIRGSAIDVVKKMEFYDQLCLKSTRINLENYVDFNGNIIVEKRSGYRNNNDIEIMRGNLVDILMDSIKEVPCYFNQEIIKIKQNKRNVEVTFNGNNTMNYDIVIGADGLRSFVRGQVFSKTSYQLVDFEVYFCIFSIPNYLKLSQKKVIFESNQRLISVTVDGDAEKAMVALMFRSGNIFNSREKKDQKSFVKQHFLNLGWECNTLMDYLDFCDDFYFDTTIQVRMKSLTQGRVALVGDSGYCPSPLSGQGTSLALVGAYVLAGQLKIANGDYIGAFASYNTLLAPFIKANQELGMLVNETFLLSENVFQEAITTRTTHIMKCLEKAVYCANLCDYD